MPRLLTFDSTHYALLAESLAREHGLAADVVPAPPDSGAACDLAIEYLVDEEERLLEVLRVGGVEFRRYER